MDIKELFNKYGNIKRKYSNFINLNPLQTAGRLTENAKKVLIEFGDGYSVCDNCKGRLDEIKSPPIYEFVHQDLPKFLGCDVARITHGAREGKFLVMHSIAKPGDTIIVDANRHYSTNVAIERAGLNSVIVENSGGNEKIINVDNYIPLIEKHHPRLIFLTYPDGELGNLPDAIRLGEIAKKYNVPYLLNGAYAIGRMPVNMDDIGADFVVGSGHKSMASAGPVGVIGTQKRWAEIIFKESKYHKGKEIECLGCTVRGIPLITLMASFPDLVERVQHWDEEVEKARWFSKRLEMLGMVQLGEKPHNHDLMKFDTDPFYQISERHPKKRAFLYEELKDNGIHGLKHGKTKTMKISTYGIPKEDLQKVIEVFENIIDTYS